MTTETKRNTVEEANAAAKKFLQTYFIDRNNWSVKHYGIMNKSLSEEGLAESVLLKYVFLEENNGFIKLTSLGRNYMDSKFVRNAMIDAGYWHYHVLYCGTFYGTFIASSEDDAIQSVAQDLGKKFGRSDDEFKVNLSVRVD